MDRLIISITELNKKNWTILYKFIKSIVCDAGVENKKDAFSHLNKTVLGIRLNTNLPAESSSDVYSLYGEEVSLDMIENLPSETCFSIIYQKENDAEDFTELVPFVLFQHEFNDLVSLGIDLEKIDIERRNHYKFKCSDFFILYDLIKPRLGNRSIYFIERDLDKETGALSKPYVTSLAGKKEDGSSTYMGNPSRRFLPLMRITDDNYMTIFGKKKDDSSLELGFVEKSINKIQNEWNGKRTLNSLLSKLNAIFDSSETPFGKWLECSYFYSYDNELRKFKPDEIQGLRNTLQIYKKSIVELVQNIVFHGGGQGFFYCVFDRKLNFTEDYHEKILGFDNYDKDARFLRIGVFDFGKHGIVDTYRRDKNIDAEGLSTKVNNPISLRDFFDKDSIVTTGLSHLDMRYSARLGLKTFVKTIIENDGYFRAESNDLDNGKSSKVSIQTEVKGNVLELGQEVHDDYAQGTHYEIILPIKATPYSPVKILPFQRTSLQADSFRQSFEYMSEKKPMLAIPLPAQDISTIAESTSKEEQLERIKNVCTKIVNDIAANNRNKKNDEIVFDFESNNRIDSSVLFKVFSYLQLNSGQGFEKIILVNTTDLFIKECFGWITKIILDQSVRQVWSRDAAIIIISENMFTRVIWGETCGELCYINKEIQKFYCNDFFNGKNDGYQEIKGWCHQDESVLNDNEIDDNVIRKANRFILPYDLMIHVKNGSISLFESFLDRLLKRRIGPQELGFLVNHENTYIGNKIIVKNYYEADMMFQNNFFTERFAYLITHNIKCELESSRSQKKKLVIIGYNLYSEILIKAIKRSLKNESVYLTIFREEKDEFTSDTFFDFDIDDGQNGDVTKQEILDYPERFVFVTIVPIGATLSTNDKIIAFFKQWHKEHSFQSLGNECFVYNHCVIVVRDDTGNCVTNKEKEQKWVGVDLSKRVINTAYNNANEIHYTIQIGCTTENKEEEHSNWIRRLNNTISFPPKWWEEKYVNFTENSSINSQNLMGVPEAEIVEEDAHETELNRLFTLKKYIYKGHIDVLNCHHKYYVDTEAFVKNKTPLLIEWLKKCVKGKGVFNHDNLNVIITPNVERESDLVFEVNRVIFEGNALIIYLDVNNWRNNMVHKLSFLKEIHKGRVKYHYVDQALLTGETYRKSKSYLFSIVGDKDTSFDSIITIVNRLSYARNQEIKNDVNLNMYAFVNLYYPDSREGEQYCELCRLTDYYKELKKRTVLDSCLSAISKNTEKLQIIHKNDINREKPSMRDFLRLVITHEIYYRISEIASQKAGASNGFRDVYDAFKVELNSIYSQMSCDSHRRVQGKASNSKINQKIDGWFTPSFNTASIDILSKLSMCFRLKLRVDKTISFLKVISSPPLSKYIAIRNYAHEKLLYELFSIISRTNGNQNDFRYDDLKTVKSILKSLSFLKSNALVRKDVIVGVWKVLGKVIDNIDIEKQRLIEELLVVDQYVKGLDKKLLLLERSQQSLFEDSIEALKNEKSVVIALSQELQHDLNSMDKESIIMDFSRDVQFFIKNAIVEDDAKATFLGELLRQGIEMSTFESIRISKTLLSLAKDGSNSSRNDLFSFFNNDVSYNDKKIFKREYTNFLVWLFYDNTTIIRKTLDNFSKELSKDKECYGLFYHKEGDDDVLNDINVFKNKLDKTEKHYREKVEKEYYYSSFRPYLLNEDGINYVQKLLYVVYAKLKLNDLNENKVDIESDTRALMEVFTNIIEANKAFWTINKNDDSTGEYYLYPISLFGSTNNEKLNKWDYDQWVLKDGFYTDKLYSCNEEIKAPLIPIYHIGKKYGESRSLQSNRIGFFVLSNQGEQNDYKSNTSCCLQTRTNGENVIASITFLYGRGKYHERDFRIHFQESGRLLLLLKNEINKYVIDYLIKDKAFDLWERRFWSIRKFEKIYANSAHIFKSVYKEMEEFEKLDDNVVKQLNNTWFFLANETISFFYSNIERNISDKNSGRHCLKLISDSLVVDEDNKLGLVFNDKYISILLALLENRWNIGDGKTNIYVNGTLLKDYKVAEKDFNIEMQMNKHLIRTIIAQCLNNSLAPETKHGHRGEYERKDVNITITNSSLIIKDESKDEEITMEEKLLRTKLFEKKKKLIKQMRCEEYSATTLTSLQGIMEYLHERNDKYGCEFGFNKDNDFYVIINF